MACDYAEDDMSADSAYSTFRARHECSAMED